jgi:hypothetical protein
MTKAMKLYKKWKKYYLKDETQENIDKSNETMIELEKAIPFKDEEEHNKWLDLGATFKFFEDFEDLTLSIIKRGEK